MHSNLVAGYVHQLEMTPHACLPNKCVHAARQYVVETMCEHLDPSLFSSAHDILQNLRGAE